MLRSARSLHRTPRSNHGGGIRPMDWLDHIPLVQLADRCGSILKTSVRPTNMASAVTMWSGAGACQMPCSSRERNYSSQRRFSVVASASQATAAAPASKAGGYAAAERVRLGESDLLVSSECVCVHW